MSPANGCKEILGNLMWGEEVVPWVAGAEAGVELAVAPEAGGTAEQTLSTLIKAA